MQPGKFVQLSIRDTGEGIAPEIKSKIFDPFFTTKEVGKGTGIGLSMVHGIVKSYGGSITCDSLLEEGTVFDISLPTVEDPSLQDNEYDLPIQTGKEHILLIDDEEMLVELGQTMLERLGYQVTARTNSLDALSTFQNQPNVFDMVITDQTMPVMTGIELARRIMQIQPEISIILCTGYSNNAIKEKAKSMGIKAFAMKPLALESLAELIRNIFDEPTNK
jgi:CheY-like chemotaxis protein